MSELDDLQAAEKRLEQAVDDVTRILGSTGVLVEWTLVTASQVWDENGGSYTEVCTLLPTANTVPIHRVMGLLDYALTRARAKITANLTGPPGG